MYLTYSNRETGSPAVLFSGKSNKEVFLLFYVLDVCDNKLQLTRKKMLIGSSNWITKHNKKAVLSQGNRAMPQLFFSV